MFTNSEMNQLSIIHPDTIECAPSTPVFNMPFDESIELRNSDYNNYPLELDINSKNINLKNEKGDWDECLKSDLESETGDDYDLRFQESIKNLCPPISPIPEQNLYEVKYKIGDGKMDYIINKNEYEMLTNAWKAITFTKNWDFVAQDIETFMFSNDPRIDEISRKMVELGYNGHSGFSFGWTMRNMQYLAQKGEEEFIKCIMKYKQ